MTDPLLQKVQELLADSSGKKVQEFSGSPSQSNSKGVVIGENHLSGVAPDWIRHNLKSLSGMGVTTLFLELPEKMQSLIDEFMLGTKSEEDLRNGIKTMNDVALEDLIKEAKAQGVTVVVMDVNYTIPDESRLNVANAHWADIIKARMANHDENYIVLAGNDHTYLDKNSPQRGIDAILGIPSIDVLSQEIINNKWQPISDPVRSGLSQSFGIAVMPESNGHANYVAVVPETAEPLYFGRYNPPN